MNTYKFLFTSVLILCLQKLVTSESTSMKPDGLKIYSKISPNDESPQADHSRFEVRNHEGAIEYRFPSICTITEVKYGEDQVCKLESGENPNALYFLLEGQNIFLVFKDVWKVYSKEDSEWTMVEEKIMESTTLDINTTSTNDEVVYSITDDTATFKPLNEKFFKIVKQGQDIIFETDDSIEYAREVIYEGVNSNDKKLTVELLCGDIKIYTKSNNNQWKDESKKESSKLDSKLRGAKDKVNKFSELLDFNTVTIILIISGGLLLLVLLGVLVKICIS